MPKELTFGLHLDAQLQSWVVKFVLIIMTIGFENLLPHRVIIKMIYRSFILVLRRSFTIQEK